MKHFENGDRVRHDYLGTGTVLKRLTNGAGEDSASTIAYIVKTDDIPPHRYNMGNRTCTVFPENLTRLTEGEQS